MGCQCYQIGGPFIAEDPDCEVHRKGGYEDRLDDAERRIAELEMKLAVAHKALAPFAVAAEHATTPGSIKKEEVVLWCANSTSRGAMGAITVADVFNAKKVLDGE